MSDTETLPVDNMDPMDPDEKDMKYLIKKVEENEKMLKTLLKLNMQFSKGGTDRRR